MRLFSRTRKPNRTSGRPPLRWRPRLESFESRWVPSTLTVTTTNDSGTGSLRAEIAAAHNGDTIKFAPGLNGQTIALTSGELLITHNLTITGPGAADLTVSGSNRSRVFEVAKNETVTLNGLTISDGDGVRAAGASDSNDGFGGGIHNLGKLTVASSTLSHNSAKWGGGVIANSGTLTVVNSTLSNNSANMGGAIYNQAHATGPLTVSNCIVSGNSARNGGGILNDATATMTVSNSTLSDNTALYQGGGIYAGGMATIRDTVLSGNTAGTFGGGIFFFNTGTPKFAVTGCTLTANSAGQFGGGIYIGGGSAAVLTVSNSSFSANSPDNIYGVWTDGGGNTLS